MTAGQGRGSGQRTPAPAELQRRLRSLADAVDIDRGHDDSLLTRSMREAADEIQRLRQGLWDVAIRTGFDNDSDETPDHMTFPDIVELALREVERLREDYDEATERRGPDA